MHSVETEYHLHVCHATNGAHIQIYCEHQKLLEVQHLVVYKFLLHNFWLKVYALLYSHLRSDTLYTEKGSYIMNT